MRWSTATIAYTIVTAPAVSTDANYNTRDAADVAGDQHRQRQRGHHGDADDDAADDDRGGRHGHLHVVLNTQPTANVTIALSSSDPAEGTVIPASLVFTSANWNVAQTVTVTGVDDAVVDGADRVHDCDGAGGRAPTRTTTRGTRPTSLVTNSDNDVAGITVTAATTPLDDDRGGRDGDLHGGAQHAADGERDDRAELEQPGRRHGPPGEPDLHERELERGADGDGDRRRRRGRRRRRSPTRL